MINVIAGKTKGLVPMSAGGVRLPTAVDMARRISQKYQPGRAGRGFPALHYLLSGRQVVHLTNTYTRVGLMHITNPPGGSPVPGGFAAPPAAAIAAPAAGIDSRRPLSGPWHCGNCLITIAPGPGGAGSRIAAPGQQATKITGNSLKVTRLFIWPGAAPAGRGEKLLLYQVQALVKHTLPRAARLMKIQQQVNQQQGFLKPTTPVAGPARPMSGAAGPTRARPGPASPTHSLPDAHGPARTVPETAGGGSPAKGSLPGGHDKPGMMAAALQPSALKTARVLPPAHMSPGPAGPVLRRAGLDQPQIKTAVARSVTKGFRPELMAGNMLLPVKERLGQARSYQAADIVADLVVSPVPGKGSAGPYHLPPPMMVPVEHQAAPAPDEKIPAGAQRQPELQPGTAGGKPQGFADRYQHAPQPPAEDLNHLADRVFSLIERRIKIERERRGKPCW